MARTSISNLELQGNSSNLNRALKREQSEKARPALAAIRKSEIAAVDGLIEQALKACRRGHTHARKANPAFGHLAVLVRTREALLRGHNPEDENIEDMIRDADEILGLNQKEVN